MKTHRASKTSFGEITSTWNPITGCLHDCEYCWAKDYAKRLASWRVQPYTSEQFKPTFAEWRLQQRIPKGKFIFVSDMGDMWGDWVPEEWIRKVLNAVKSKLASNFFFLTKNPKRYLEFQDEFIENMMLGVTIETNRSYILSKAPTNIERFTAMKKLKWKHKAVVIEPILEFDVEFVDWIKDISPVMVSIGYDNYHHKLPEPELKKTQWLVNQLSQFTEVRAKSLRKAWYENK